MTFRQMEAICAYAKTLSFSRAAEKIYISQSAFSREIDALEKELGCQLIVRSRKSPCLTAAGERIVRNAELIISQLQEIEHTAEMARSGSLGELKVGYMNNGLPNKAIEIFHDFMKDNPGVQIETSECSEADMYTGVEMGRFDFGIVIHRNPAYRNLFETRKLDSCRQCIIVNKIHPLAERSSVRFSELSRQKFIILDAQKCNDGYAFIMNKGMENQFVPQIVSEADSVYSMLFDVSCNMGIALGIMQMKDSHIPNLVFIPLEEEPDVDFHLIWSKNNQSRIVEQFIRTILSQ